MSALSLIQRFSTTLARSTNPFAAYVHHGVALRAMATTTLRDPDRPKKNTTAWLLYLSDFRKTAPADLKSPKLMQEAASKWKTLPALEKQPYESQAAEEKKKYDAAMKEYVDSGKKDAWKRDPERPVRPLTGFFRYSQQARSDPSVKDLKPTEQMKKISAQWKALPPLEKKPYEEAALKEMQAYKEALKKYKESGKEEAWLSKTGRKAVSDKKDARKEWVKAQKAVEKIDKAVKRAARSRKTAEKKLKTALEAAEKKEKQALKALEKGTKTEASPTASDKEKAAASKALTQAKKALEMAQKKLASAKSTLQVKVDEAIKKEKAVTSDLLVATKEKEKAKAAMEKAAAEVKKYEGK